jgi:hypothetical protein
MIYSGSLGEISNKADWISQVYTLVNESDGQEVDLSSEDIDVTIEIVIREPGCTNNVLSGSLADGTIALSGGGFFWHFAPDDLGVLCGSKTYDVGVKVTIDDVEHDVILATVAVLWGV